MTPKRPIGHLAIIAAIYIASIAYAGIGFYYSHFYEEPRYCFDEIVNPILGN